MSAGTVLCIIIYDVVLDRQRNRLHKLLKQYGEPVQFSAFEARLTLAERRQLIREVARIITPATDRCVIYPVGGAQERGVLCVGQPRPDVQVPSFFLV